ncbi:receptor-type tyrosine-protein phosphatase kappa-like isoform X3 [Saccostrea cucullata]|uniref:receptor-type tyrosine-protein phosphatase kappa-like isoform X3 n=1 Tax=Saccostrea cuccullata TaxID=36930 RepID=UPI002ED38DB7
MDLLLHVICVGIIFINVTSGLENLARNLAFKEEASQSSTHDAGWATADKAVDGHLEGDGYNECSFTRAFWGKTAWWKLTLTQWSNVAYLQFFFRKSTENRHIGFNVIVFNDTSYAPSSSESDDGYKVFTQDPSHCIKQEMNVTVNRVTKGIAVFNSKDPPLNTTCKGYVPGFATIEICEIKVMGCHFQNYGQNCRPCPSKCLNQECDAFDGSCIYGCSDKLFEPPDCMFCRDGFYGNNCEGTCGKCNNNAVCNKITGICPDGCHYQWNGSLCNVCQSSFYGGNCTKTCGHCKPGTYCHNVTGLCMEGCDDHWNGSLCNVCKDGFYGENCSSCGSCVNGTLCNNITGICPDGCEHHWNGTKCDECVDGYYGSSCIRTCENCIQTKCTKTGYCLLGYRDNMKENNLPLGGSTAGIIGGVITSIIIAVFVVISLVIAARRRVLHKDINERRILAKTFEEESNKIEENPSDINSDLNQISTQESSIDIAGDCVYYNTNQTSSDIKIEDLQKSIATKIVGEKSPFLLEYNRLPHGDVNKCHTAREKENLVKNRFKTTFPYEHSRVILKEKWNKDDNDYINANYVRDLNGESRFIATQGPSKNTIADFWRMVLQENIDCVLILTNIVENGKNKCTQYWPNKDHPMKIGQCKVSLLEESEYAFYTVRKLSIKRQNPNELRTITQFHYTAWPDHGTPEEIELVQFHRAVLKVWQTGPPLLVHCSAGVGRTGTYIGLNVLLQQGRETGRINVFDFVKQMREDRMSMVQTVEQYVFLHKALLCGFQDIETVISEHDFRAKVLTLLNDASPFNQQQLNKEFQLLVVLKPVFDIETFEDAVKPANRTKNMDMDILPASKYRPFLTTYVRGKNDYINAVFISTFRNPLGFIVTQNPLPDTEVDVWRLCKDHDVESVVVLSDDNMGTYWLPNGGEKLQCKPFTIITKTNRFDSDDIQQDRLLVSTDDYRSFIEVFRIPSENDAALLKVAKILLEKENASTSLVISSNGAGPAGVFCVLHNALEQLRMDGEVDMFTRVRQIQTRRPEVITTLVSFDIIGRVQEMLPITCWIRFIRGDIC